jgi:hypothetical protein
MVHIFMYTLVKLKKVDFSLILRRLTFWDGESICLMEEPKRIFLIRVRKRSLVVSEIKICNMGSHYNVKESLF